MNAQTWLYNHYWLFLLEYFYSSQALVSWREFGCRDNANAWRKSTKEAAKHKIFLLQFRK